MAVTLARPDNSRTLGVAYCNVTTRKLGACEFVDSEQYCTLESILLQLGAKEVVMPKVRCTCQRSVQQKPSSFGGGFLEGFPLIPPRSRIILYSG